MIAGPKCREEILPVRSLTPLAIGAVTHRALCGVDFLAPCRIRRPANLNACEAPASDRGARRHVLRQPPDVGQDAPHLVAVIRQRLAVHGPLKAVVDAVLKCIDPPIAASILGKRTPDPDPR